MNKKLKNALHKGECFVTFTKKDGSTRVMRCTLVEDFIPAYAMPKPVKKGEEKPALSNEVCRVWDMDESGWRSFRWDSIKDWEKV